MGVGQKTHMFKDGGATLGACCNYGGGGTAFCFNTTSADCAAGGGSFSGDGVYCGGSGICNAPLDCCGVVGASGCGYTCGGTGASACACNDCSVGNCWDCATVSATYTLVCGDIGCGAVHIERVCNITFDVTDVSGSVCTPGAAGNSITWKTCGAASESGDCIWVKLDLDHNEAAGGTALPWSWGIDNSVPASSVCWSELSSINDPGCGACFLSRTSCGVPPNPCGLGIPAASYPVSTTNTCSSYIEKECVEGLCYTIMDITLNCA